MARTKPIAQLNDWRLFQLGSSRWSLRWTDSRGKHRITFHASSLESAIVEAHRVRESDTRKGQPYRPNPIAKPKPVERIRISDALLRSAESRDWTDEYRKNEMNYCRYFLRWVDQQDYHYWDELRLEHIEGYVIHLRQQNKKPQTIQHYLKPVKRAGAWVSANFVVPNICQALLLPKRTTRREIHKVLWLHQGLDFLDWLSKPRPCTCQKRCECVKRRMFLDRLIPGAALQMLCGLRLKEALGIRWTDIGNGSIRVSGEKNEYSLRVIPVPEMVVYVLRNWGHKGEFVVKPYSEWRHYSRALRKVLLQWNPRLGNISPKNLRKTLFREAKHNGWYGWEFEAYMGHATTGMLDVTRRHYDGDRAEDLFPVLQRKVLPEIEKTITEWDAPVDTVLIPEPRITQVVQGLFKVEEIECKESKTASVRRLASQGMLGS